MKKKLILIISSILCFIGLAFLITMRSSMPVLALGNVSIQDNDTFSNDLLVDLDYYSSFDSSVDSTNYFAPSYLVSTWSDSGISNVSFATGYLRFKSNSSWRYVYYQMSASPNTAYYFSYSTVSNNWVSTIVDNNNITLYSANTWNSSSNINIVFTTKSNTSFVTFKFSNMQHVVNPDSANVISPITYSNIVFRKTDIDNKPLFGFAIQTSDSSITSNLSYLFILFIQVKEKPARAGLSYLFILFNLLIIYVIILP